MSAGAHGFFGALSRGVQFDAKKIHTAKQHFKKRTDENAAAKSKQHASELDFFGFDAKKSEPKAAKRERKISVDMVPTWAGGQEQQPDKGATKTKKKAGGSMPRRKRKLSEGALEEERLVEEERHQASMLLAPKSDKEKTDLNNAKASKKKNRKRKNRSESMGSEATEKDEEEEEAQAAQPVEDESEDSDDDDDDDAEDQQVELFKKTSHDSDDDDSDDANAVKGKKKKKTNKSKTNKLMDAKLEREKEEVRLFRKQMNIRVDNPSTASSPIATFDAMKLNAQQEKLRTVLLKNIELSEYKEPTAIQMQAIPSLLLGRDVLATAPTGSGKTAAFAIPMLLNLGSPKQEGIRAVVLSPTRELAVQIHQEFLRLSAGRKFHIVLLSKATASTMQAQIKNKCTVNHDIIVATPLRLVHLIQEAKLDLSMCEMVCLDEADRLFDMGFVEQIDEVLAACCHPRVQRAMFSATMLQGVEEMAQSVLREPVKIVIGTKNAGAKTISQKLVFVGKEEGKLVAMKQLIQDGVKIPALLFVQNKERANELYQELLYDGVNVGTVHADRTKEQRDETMRQFRTGSVWVLICTDLMSRGIDFKAVNMVINYDFPQDAVSYIHRIGRTGRGGREGHAVTFFTEDDMLYLRSIANVMKLSGCEVPDWMLKLKKASAERRKKLIKAPLERKRISTVSGYDLHKQHKRHLTNTKHQKTESGKDAATA